MSKTIYVPASEHPTNDEWEYHGIAFTSENEALKYIECNDSCSTRLFEFMLFDDSDDVRIVCRISKLDVGNFIAALGAIEASYGVNSPIYNNFESTINAIFFDFDGGDAE